LDESMHAAFYSEKAMIGERESSAWRSALPRQSC
jgi:hypothetical protein